MIRPCPLCGRLLKESHGEGVSTFTCTGCKAEITIRGRTLMERLLKIESRPNLHRDGVAVVRSDGKRYRSMSEAAEDMTGDRRNISNIRSCIKGYQKQAYGYGWRRE